MKYLVYCACIFLFLLQGCSNAPMISGTLDMTKGQGWKPMVYLVQPEGFGALGQSFTGKLLDSSKVDSNGHFQFGNQVKIKDTVLFEVVVQKEGERYSNRLENENPETDNYFPLVWTPGEQIVMKAAINRFQASATVENPSSVNAAFMQLRDIKKNAFVQYQESLGQQEWDEQLLEREKAHHTYQYSLMQFADTTQQLFPALMAIRWVSPEGNYERIPEFLVEQSQQWKTKNPEHPWVKELAASADTDKLPILIGDQMPNLQFPMNDGSKSMFKEVVEGKKLLLLDVWASWCAPCRLENRNVLVPLWEKYHEDGFQILAYGLESSQQAWENAIDKDGAYRWLHASHVEGDQNPLMDSLRIKTIPANFLLDANGMVLAKNLHGDDLVQLVDDYMARH